MSDSKPEERELGLVHVYAICTGAMFSSGFFLLPGVATASTGGSVPIAYLIAGFLVLPALLSTAELATAFPRAGGPYHFLHRSLGPAAALVGALGLWVAMMLKAAFALVGIGVYLDLLVEVPADLVAVGLAVAFTALNVFGARESARLQVVLVALLLVVLGGFIVAGALDLLGGDRGPAADEFAPFLDGGIPGLLAASAMVFVAYAGVLQVASVADQVRRPERTIALGLLLALATTSVIYVVGTALMVVLLGVGDLAGDDAPMASAAEALAVPFGLVLVVGAALAAFASTGNAGIMSAARYPLTLARERLLWGRFARLNGRGAPTWAVLLTGLTTIGMILALDVEGIASLASALLLVVFALLNIAVIVLRRGRVAGYRPGFRSPLYPWVQWFGVLTSIVLVVDLGVGPAAFSTAVLVVATTWYAVARRSRDVGSGAGLRLVRRLRGRVPDESVLDAAAEPGARARELIESMSVGLTEDGGEPDAVRTGVARLVADRLGVGPAEVAYWLADRRHLSLRLEDPAVEIHQLQLDWGDESFVALTWAPGENAESDESSGSRRGPTAVVVAGPPHDRDLCLSVASLLIRQLSDDMVDEQWPDSTVPDRANESVREILVSDVAWRVREAEEWGEDDSL